MSKDRLRQVDSSPARRLPLSLADAHGKGRPHWELPQVLVEGRHVETTDENAGACLTLTAAG